MQQVEFQLPFIRQWNFLAASQCYFANYKPDYQMKYNPLTGEIYTDKDEFVKKMSCPWLMKWADLQEAGL